MSNSAAGGTDSPYVSWTKDLAIGHELLDADHEHIFDIANRLQAEFQGDPEYSIVGEVLVELIEHTGEHFSHEEALMRSLQYPGYEAHKQQHVVLMERVNALHRRFMQGHKNVSLEVSEFMQQALIPHIADWDRKLGQSLRGIK